MTKFIRYETLGLGNKRVGLFGGQIEYGWPTQEEQSRYRNLLRSLPTPPWEIRRKGARNIFAFKNEAPAEWLEIISMIKNRWPKTKIFRMELDSEEYEIVWEDDKQVALKRKISKRKQK